MKKIFFFLFLLSSLTVLAQNDIAKDTTRNPAITEKGKPDGVKTEMKIGKEGGTLVSFDRKAEMIVPAGAVSKKTTFSIQPVSNTSPNADGTAYLMEPSGVQFQQPVKLVFHYTKNTEEDDSLQFLKGIAMQDDAGHWTLLKNFKIDTAAKTLSGNVEHFCTMALINAINLSFSGHHYVKVNHSLRGFLDKGIDYAEGVRDTYSLKWYVNGIQNGNDLVGRVKGFESVNFSKIGASVTYTAPAIVPDNNPVTIKALIENINFEFNGVKYNTLQKEDKIVVYDNAYEVKIEMVIKDEAAGTRLGTVTHSDHGSFIVSLKKNEATLLNIKNENESFSYDETKCLTTLLNEGANTGLVNIGEIKRVKVTPAQPPNNLYPIVEIEFVTTVPVFSRIEIFCPDVPGSGMPPEFGGMFGGMRTQPVFLKFIAKEGKQVILEFGKSGGPEHYIVTVEKLPDD